ncbi:MAG: beta-ketoacyl-ACP synthase I, partial [Rhodanobacteraceae bacterium]
LPHIDLEAMIDRKLKRFMGDAAAYACVAMRSAIADAGLTPDQISHPRTGVVAGSGGGSPQWQIAVADLLRGKGVRRVGPYMVPRTMCSTVSAALATAFGILGISYSIAAACATSAHCIGAAADLIRHGTQDVVFAGGGEEVHWGMTAQFDAMGALSTSRNGEPGRASRPYDAGRDGFVISGGGGMLVLESLDHARARGANIHAELLGYGVTSDGADMVTPSGEGAARCMKMALAGAGHPVDYLNTHGTATPVGDIVELEAVRVAFGTAMPPMSSTKALTGHALGAASVHEAIYSLAMLKGGFVAGSANIDTLDPRAEGFPILRESRPARLATVMSNSFGFGGTNASLVFGRV